MYNGIGLATVRGSATSGHVTKNMSYLKPEFFRNKLDSNQSAGRYSDSRSGKHGANYKVNKEVIEHNRKHAVEAKIFEFEDSLRENGGLTEEEIGQKVEDYRARLNRQNTPNSNRSTTDTKGSLRITDTHEISARKSEENERLRSAFGIRSDFVAGSSFDPVAQEQRKKDREAERAAKIEQNKADRLRRDKLREERLLLRGAEEEGEQERSAHGSGGRGGIEDRGRGGGKGSDRRGPPYRREREKYVPKDCSKEEYRDSSRSRSRSREVRKRGRSNSRNRKDGDSRRRDSRESRDRDSRRRIDGDVPLSPSRLSGEAVDEERKASHERATERTRDHSHSRSSSSTNSSSSSSSRISRSASTSRSRERSPVHSPPRRKTRWGDK